jgi:hypothetical protein
MDDPKYQVLKQCLNEVLSRRTDKNIKVFIDDRSIDPAILSAMSRAYDQGFADGVKKQLGM